VAVLWLAVAAATTENNSSFLPTSDTMLLDEEPGTVSTSLITVRLYFAIY
jgi:hypothetical protein